jgi:hypothetical protein
MLYLQDDAFLQNSAIFLLPLELRVLNEVQSILKGVSELRIRFVCKIVFVGMFEGFHGTRLVSFLVLPNTDVAVDDGEKCSNDGGDKNCNEAWCIDWCICRLEQQGTDEVA